MPKMSICKQGSTKFDKSRDDVWLKYIDIVDKNYSTNHQSLNIFLDNIKNSDESEHQSYLHEANKSH